MQQGEEFVTNLKAKKYEVRGAFGSESTKMADQNISLGSLEAVQDQLKWLKQEILANRIPEGSQVVIQVSSHGDEKNEKDRAHKVAMPMSDKNHLLDLADPTLQFIIQELDKRKVKVAFFDFSCYSGSSLDLASGTKHTCFISSSNRYNASEAGIEVGDFGQNFWQIWKGSSETQRDLESIFLKTRIENKGFDLPEISTPTHQVIRAIWDLYFSTELLTSPKENREQVFGTLLNCYNQILPTNYKKMFEDLMKSFFDNDPEFVELKAMSLRLKKMAQQADKILPFLKTPIEIGPQVRLTFEQCQNYYEEGGVLKGEALAIKEGKPGCIGPMMKSKMRESYQEYKQLEQQLSILSMEQQQVESDFRQKEREVYQRFYDLIQDEGKEKNNSCREFKL